MGSHRRTCLLLNFNSFILFTSIAHFGASQMYDSQLRAAYDAVSNIVHCPSPKSYDATFPLPFLLLPFPSLPSCFLPFPPIPFPSLRSRTPSNPVRGLGQRCELPQRGLGGAPAEIESGAF